MTGQDPPAVIHDGQARVQIGIVAEHVLHDVILELIMKEECVVGLEEDIGTILVLCTLSDITRHDASLKGSLAHLAVTIALHLEVGAQGVDGLHADTIQTHRLLEGLRIVFTTRIQHRYSLDQLSLRNTTPIVAHGNPQVLIDVHFNPVTGLHLKLVDGIVDDFLQQHVDAVFGQ